MTDSTSPPPGWYPDPAQTTPETQRYWDGQAWTHYLWPQMPDELTQTVSQLGWGNHGSTRPTQGPGSLASPAQRLCARIIDGAIWIPVTAVIVGIFVLIAAPHVGEVFPPGWAEDDYEGPMPGIIWFYIVGFAAVALSMVLFVVYEAVATAKYGRTIGKAALHIRPLRSDGSVLSGWRCIARTAFYNFAGQVSGLGLLDVLWCLWDEDKQCLHDKAVDSVVLRDR